MGGVTRLLILPAAVLSSLFLAGAATHVAPPGMGTARSVGVRVGAAPVVPAPPGGAAGTSPENALGTGSLAKFACLGCLGTLLGAGGTSILGVAVMIVLFSELAAACGLGCTLAYS